MALKPIEILKDTIESVAHRVTISSVVSLGSSKYQLNTTNTLYLKTINKVIIDSVEYKIVDSVINSYITVVATDGTDTPVTVSFFDIDAPLFVWGNPQMVSAEIIKRIDNKTIVWPYMWVVEISDTERTMNPAAAVKQTAKFNIFFLNDTDKSNWTIEDHYEEDIYTLSNYLDFFQSILKSRRDIFETDSIDFTTTNHVNFGDYIVDEGMKNRILNDDVTGIQVQIDLPLIIDTCSDFVVTANCPIITETFNAVSISSPLSFKNIIVQTDAVGNPQTGTILIDTADSLVIQVASGGACVDATVENSDLTYTDSVSSGATLVLPDITHTQTDGSPETLPAQTPLVCDTAQPVTQNLLTSLGTVPLTDTPSGQNVNYKLTNLDGDEITPIITTDTANEKTILISNANENLNGVPTTGVIVGDTVKEIVTQDTLAGVVNPIVLADNGFVLRLEFQDSNVSNSDDSYSVDVLSQQDLELPDITHTQTDGSPEILPAQTALVCDPGLDADNQVNGVAKTAIPSGGSKDFVIQDTGGTPVVVTQISDSATQFVGEVPDGVGAFYYNMPQPTWNISYNTYDEGWHNINGTYDNTIPINGITQQLANGDFYKVQFDAEGLGHTYRFIGIDAGYYNSDDGLYYLANGTVSTRTIVFNTAIYAFDRLTGLAWILGTFGPANLVSGIASVQAYAGQGFTNYEVPFLAQLESIIDTSLTFPLTGTISPVFNMLDNLKTTTPSAATPTTTGWYMTNVGNISQGRTYTINDRIPLVRDARGQF